MRNISVDMEPSFRLFSLMQFRAGMAQPHSINIEAFIDKSRLGALQLRVLLLGVAIALLEGYDTQVIGFTAPSMAQDWGISRASLGMAFSSSLVGLMIGALVLGVAGDRFGRKLVTTLSFAAVGVSTLLTAYVSTVNELIFLRFLTGLAIGGTLPSAIALVSEYSPSRLRALCITVMVCGFPLGSALGGLVAAPVISEYGWRAAYVFGGILPIVLSVALLFYLPESLRFLLRDPSRHRLIGSLLERIDASYSAQEGDRFEQPEQGPQKTGVRGIFADGRMAGSFLLWLLFALNLLMLYLMINWLPTILTEHGFDLNSAIFTTSLFNAGGILSSILLSRVMDRASPFPVLTGTYLFAAVVTALAGVGGVSEAALVVLVCLSGAGILGPQLVLNALAANFYPAEMRSAGVGASLSAGRVGAIVGPLAGSALMGMGLPATQIFMLLAIPAIVCAAAIFALGRQKAKVRNFQPIREFDHLMCGMKDIAATGRRYEALGFTVGPATPLEGIGVMNSRILLTPKDENLANYIEFMQLSGASGEVPSFLQKWLKGSLTGQEGAHCLIMRTDDAQRTYAHFDGLNDQNPLGGFKPFLLEKEFLQDGPGGETYTVGFANCIFPELEPPLYVSTSQIKTLDFYLNEKWRTHRNGALSWTETVAVSRTPEATAEALQDLWGGHVIADDSECLITTPGKMPLKIYTPEQFEAEYGVSATAADRSYIAGVHISVKNLDDTKLFFEQADIEVRLFDDKLVLPPDVAHGLMLCFEQDEDA